MVLAFVIGAENGLFFKGSKLQMVLLGKPSPLDFNNNAVEGIQAFKKIKKNKIMKKLAILILKYFNICLDKNSKFKRCRH